MSYTALESSKDSGKPIFLYEFVQGDNIWRFNSSATDFVWSAQIWKASSVSHSSISQSNDLSKDSIDLKFSVENEFANQFLGYAPDVVTSVTIFRGHLSDSDSDFIVYWKGRVSGSKAGGHSVNLNCESIFTSLRRPGLRARYQRTCRHALYGKACRLNPEAFAIEAIPSALSASGVVVTVPAAAAYPSGYFFGGMLKASDGSLRLIVGHSGASITISRPIRQLSQDFAGAGGLGLWVTIYPGCDRSTAVCSGRFDNLDNYGGFPFIPTKNPFGGSSIV